MRIRQHSLAISLTTMVQATENPECVSSLLACVAPLSAFGFPKVLLRRFRKHLARHASHSLPRGFLSFTDDKERVAVSCGTPLFF